MDPNNYAMSPSIQSPMMAMNYNTNQFGHPGSPGMVMAHPQQYAQTPAGHMSAYPHQQHPYAGTSYPSPTSPTQFQQPPPPKPLHGGWGEQPDVPTVNVSLADHAERSHRHHRHHHHHHHRHHRSSSRKRRSSRHDLEHDDYHDDHHDARHDAHHDVHHEDGGRNRPSTGSPVRKTQVDERHGSPARPSTRLDDAHRPKAGQSPTKSGHEHDEHAESPTLKGNAKLPTKPLLLHTDAFDHNDDHDHGGVHSVRVSKVERKGHEAEQEPKRNSTVKVTTERKAAPSPVKPPVKKDVHDEEHFFDEPTPSKGKMGSPKKPAHGDEHHDHSTNHEETGASAKRTSTVKPPGTRDLEGHEEERKERVSLGTTSHPSKDVNIDDAHTAAGGTSKTRGAPKNQKKALLIGISYRDKDNRTAKVNKAGVSVLENSIGDVLAVKKMLTDNFGYADAPDQMRVLVDDSEDPARRPTRQNILKELEWLRQGAKAGDQLYLHFCGHGSVPHSAKGSLDELDDGLLPCDYEKGAGKPRVAEITDRDMNTYLVHGLPKGVKVTCVLDCLQQNTLLDLPFVYNQEGYYKGTPEIREEHEAQGNRSSEADVILLSACKDESQTGVDVSSKPEGAITHGLIEAVNEAGRKDKPIKDMVKLVRQVLLKKSKYTHRPQLSAGHNVNMSGEFFFGKGDS
ncbi:Ca(2+)-dependent cysteine protease [Irineochytrium annulatum]|nr:Ca(2+)-dependent cysteine protease [Irineochytrium annulatum]